MIDCGIASSLENLSLDSVNAQAGTAEFIWQIYTVRLLASAARTHDLYSDHVDETYESLLMVEKAYSSLDLVEDLFLDIPLFSAKVGLLRKKAKSVKPLKFQKRVSYHRSAFR